MVQRLNFNTDVILNIVKTLDSVFTPSKIYDYANFITIQGNGLELVFEMCVILDGASTDAMVRLKALYNGEPFEPIVLGYDTLSKVVKTCKDETIDLEVGDTTAIVTSRSKHYLERSTVGIPVAIRKRLDEFIITKENELLDFNLLNAYNILRDVGGILQEGTTLRRDLFGIYADENYTVASTGITTVWETAFKLSKPFLFPKAFLDIAKSLPKLGVQAAIEDHVIYLKGKGFECYVSEWSGFRTYPAKKLKQIYDANNFGMIEVEDVGGLLQALREIFTFTEVAHINLSEGTVCNETKTNTVHFKPVMCDDKMLVIRKKSLVDFKGEPRIFVSENRKFLLSESGTTRTLSAALQEGEN